MQRFWRSEADVCLAFCFLLEVIALALSAVSRPALSTNGWPLGLALTAFLLWRVSRGGRTSRIVLIILFVLVFGETAWVGPRQWNQGILALLVIYAAQLVLLISPAVYQRTRPDWQPGQAVQAIGTWARPPRWMVLSALLAGVVVTLLFLGSENWVPIAGCGPSGAAAAQLPGRCFTLAQGSPLRFLTADHQGVAFIDKAGLIADWAQWALVSFTLLYLLWLPSRRNPAERGEPTPVEHVTPV
ncbi:MAG TPA: hypothetical protein VGI64_06920 [Streptosporangiaceae bacterium]|jgi:hypothetical protein